MVVEQMKMVSFFLGITSFNLVHFLMNRFSRFYLTSISVMRLIQNCEAIPVAEGCYITWGG